jgi:hypothetical protein
MDTLISINKKRKEYIEKLYEYKSKRNIKSTVTDTFMNILMLDNKLYKLYLCFYKCMHLYIINK